MSRLISVARRAALVTLAGLALGLLGCSSDDSGTPPPIQPTSTATVAQAATRTPTSSPTAEATDTATVVPPSATATATSSATATNTVEPTETATETATPTETPTITETPTETPTATATEPPLGFTARGSVEQLYIVDAAAGTPVELLDSDGNVVRSDSTDDNGSLVFRDLTPEADYRVATGEGESRVVSNPRHVSGIYDDPDPSLFTKQQINRGYGYLETRDGTLLAINVLMPGPAEQGPYPTVIEYSGYDPANPDAPQPSMLIANALGYAAVGVNIRGIGCSGGSFRYFEATQSTDGYDAIEAVAAQPWVKGGKVGMVGISYPGISQLFTAQTRPPHLAAIAPLSVIADTGRGILFAGGILNNGFALSWAAERQHDAQVGGQAWAQKRIDAGDQVCIDNQKLRGQTPDVLRLIDENRFYVPEVGDPLAPATFVGRIQVPVFLAGAWQDEQTGPYFATMLDKFSGTDKAFFTVVNGAHTESLIPVIMARWMEFLDLYVAEKVPRRALGASLVLGIVSDQVWGVQGLQFPPERFTGVTSLEEARAQFEADPRLRILFESGAGGQPGYPIPAFEAGFDSWPVPGLIARPWYFAADGRLEDDPPTGDGADTYQYDPDAGQRTNHPNGGGDVWRALPAWNWQPLEPGKAVAYATDVLPETVVMAGSGSIDLWLQATAEDVDLQVTLSEIRPDGEEVYVQSGWLRASHRKLDEDESTELRPVQTHLEADAAPLPEGEFVEARVELYPFAHAFRAGSRIRLSVESPGGDRAAWKFESQQPDGDVFVTIARSETNSSRVVLPVISGVEVTPSLPPCPGLRSQPCRTYQELSNGPG